MTAMHATLAKFYPINVKPNWLLVIVVLLAAIVLAALIIWRGWKQGD